MANPRTYIGYKGYSIWKSSISIEDQQFIRNSLMARPFIPGSPIKSEAFPIYRESPKKLYLPKFFGIQHYGEPLEIKISDGDDIHLNFSGELRDYQTNIINIFMKNIDEHNGGLLEIPCGRGKTVLAVNLIAKLKKKTLVIVHKEFLLNQWIERINQFLPNAKIGRIQGQTIDIEDKDIVIGMLQSLSMKDYPEDMFKSFGFTIVDECHHISSEIFSRSLSTIVTKYTLGLSATMQRKDGLSKVFKMFLGDIVYKEKRDTNDPVLVKAIEYKTMDEEYNTTDYDYRGNPAFSKMITKVCSFSYRTEFIIEVIKNELTLNSQQQIMVLAQNKNILTYLYKAISSRDISDVGYYVGGMKQEKLKLSEKKTIILATYAMAAEALDIKTLTTLVLASPRTDITQAVGRILRVKHDNPLVIDIIDGHDVFKKQWSKRKAYYKKCGYKIIHTTSEKYMNNEWKTLIEEKQKKKKQCLIKI